MKKPDLITNRTALFDWFVFIASVSLGFIFPSLGELVKAPEFSWCMLITFILYVTGSWLKHMPLSERITRTGKKREISWIFFLLCGHWCIMILLIIFAEGAVFRTFGMPSMLAKGSKNGAFIFFTLIASLFITWLVYRSKNLPRSYKPKPEYWLQRRELIADICLVISVSVLTYVIWERGIMAMLSKSTVDSIGQVWFLFFILSFTYVLLYLPLRYLYLIEDHTSRQTWKRLLLIFGFLLLRSLFEILQIT